MADKRISDLTHGGSIQTGDLAEIERPGSPSVSRKVNLGATLSDLSAHTANTSNPHSVTKTQVGLSNVDNTADADKPVSTAQQAALDAKLNLPVETTIAAVSDIANAINTTGKARFKQAADENDRQWWALGSDAADPWRPFDDQSGLSDITPA